jgi:hypothetical protein
MMIRSESDQSEPWAEKGDSTVSGRVQKSTFQNTEEGQVRGQKEKADLLSGRKKGRIKRSFVPEHNIILFFQDINK